MTIKIPLVDLKAHHEPIRDELIRAFSRCLDESRFVLGEEVEKLEAGVAAYCDVPFAVGVSSGTDALLVIAMALDIGPGDEVLTTPYSFFATAGTIARLGARPVFADIDAETFNLDPAGIEERITGETKAILPVHLFGQLADVAPILEIAKRREVVVIEDAAQAIGARDRDGRPAGGFGAAAALSFYPSKNLGALGDGGMVLTREPELAESIRRLRTHGGFREYLHEQVGGNFRLDAIQAAALRVKLGHLSEWTHGRKERAKCYDALFDESGLVSEGLLVTPRARADHVYHQYVIRARAGSRDALRAHLSGLGIATGIYYPVPLHLQTCFRALGYEEGDFPVAERVAKDSLALPMYPQLTAHQQETVVGAVTKFFSK